MDVCEVLGFVTLTSFFTLVFVGIYVVPFQQVLESMTSLLAVEYLEFGCLLSYEIVVLLVFVFIPFSARSLRPLLAVEDL